MIFQTLLRKENLIGILTSKTVRYLTKTFIGHTVHAQVDELKELSIPITPNNKIIDLILQIIRHQKQDIRYDYSSQEQLEIDKLVYEAYGLSMDDITEIETWYIRRYPKLSAAQKANLRKLGKSDDYLVLYGLK